MSNEPQTSIPSLMDQANLAKYYDPEHGIRYEFNVHTGNWDARRTRVRLTEYPFARGGMRYCHFVREVESDGGEIACIAKFFLPSCKAKHEDYFMEASAQCTADSFAQEYNRRHTPQKIAFLSCCVVHLVNRRENNIFIMEPLLKGEFTKHNNNFGAVFTDQITPEAFSHFTFEISNGRMLVCDIQGVGEFFTDPQIHTPVGIDYGMGNMGTEGIDRWVRAHRCNDICRSLRLTPIRALQLNTMPPSNRGTTNNTNKMNTHRESQGVEEQKIELEKRPTLQEQIKDLKNMSLRETQTPEKPISQITDQLTENTKDRLQSEGERAPIPYRSEEASMDSITSALEVQSVAMQSYYRLRETARRQEAEAQEEAQRSGTRQVSTPASLLQPRQESHPSAVQEPSAEEQRASSADSSTQDETERETSPTVVAFEVQPLPSFPSVSSSTHFYEENAASADPSQNASPSRNTTESSVAASDSRGPTSPLNRSSKTPSRPSARPVSPNTRDLINSMSEEDRLEEAIRRSLLEM